MTRMPRVTGQDVIRALYRAGFELSHTRGSHYYLRPAGGGRLVVGPVHGGKTIPAGTMHAILRQAGLSSDELARLLRSWLVQMCRPGRGWVAGPSRGQGMGPARRIEWNPPRTFLYKLTSQ